jgi:hypothetical protein
MMLAELTSGWSHVGGGRHNSDEGRHAARTDAAPAGANGLSVVNIHEIASARRRAMSIRAIFLPRLRPRRLAVEA